MTSLLSILSPLLSIYEQKQSLQDNSYLPISQGCKKLLENLSKYQNLSFREKHAGHLLVKTWELAESVVPILFKEVMSKIRDKKLSSFFNLLKNGQNVELSKVNIPNQVKFIQNSELGNIKEVSLVFNLDKDGGYSFRVEGQAYRTVGNIKIIIELGSKFKGQNMNDLKHAVLSVLIHELTHFWNTKNQKNDIISPEIIRREGKTVEEENIISYLLADSEIEAFVSQILHLHDTSEGDLEDIVFRFITNHFSRLYTYYIGRDPSEEIIQKIHDSLSEFIEKHFPIEEGKSADFQKMLKSVHPGDKKDLIGRGENSYTNDGESVYRKFQRSKSAPPVGEGVDRELSYLNEVFQYETKNFKPKFSLCPNVWTENGHLLPKIEQKLNIFVQEFLKNEKRLKNYDIFIVGSLASYLWTGNSDLDIIILFNFFDLKDDFQKTKRKFKEKSLEWVNKSKEFVENHRITIDVHHTHGYLDGGIYSILQKKWINMPIQYKPTFDSFQIAHKVENFVHNLFKLHELLRKNKKEAKELTTTMKAMAKSYKDSALEDVGEFSIEHAVYRILKKNGFVRKLLNYEKEI